MSDRLKEIETTYADASAAVTSVTYDSAGAPTTVHCNHIENIQWLIDEARRLLAENRALQRDAALGARIRHAVSVEEGEP